MDVWAVGKTSLPPAEHDADHAGGHHGREQHHQQRDQLHQLVVLFVVFLFAGTAFLFVRVSAVTVRVRTLRLGDVSFD